MNAKIIRGANQIGGNIIEIATTTTKILLDVGLELDNDKNNSLPQIDGLFDKKGYDAVFISHYHGDHLGLAYFINKEIPIYIGKASYKILKASDGYKNAESIEPKGFLMHKIPIIIGDITITPYLCDHSACDSYMLLCEADGEKVLYTGDFRSNGRKSYKRFLKELPQKIDTLICEGTTLSRKDNIAETESQLEERAVKIFKSKTGPVFILQSAMNIDRIVTMYRAAKRSERMFLQDLYMAQITSAAGGTIPNPQFSGVKVFITNGSKYDGLCKYKNRVGKEFISNAKFAMCIRTSMLSYLKSLATMMSFENGVIVYSLWSGYKKSEEMQLFLASCEELGLEIVTLHTSGHADSTAIKTLIATVNPTEILPIHTENAKWFSQFKI